MSRTLLPLVGMHCLISTAVSLFGSPLTRKQGGPHFTRSNSDINAQNKPRCHPSARTFAPCRTTRGVLRCSQHQWPRIGRAQRFVSRALDFNCRKRCTLPSSDLWHDGSNACTRSNILLRASTHARASLPVDCKNPSFCHGRAFKWCNPPGADYGEPYALTGAPLASAVPWLAEFQYLWWVGFTNVLS
jgi:hypothetical protein